MASIPLYSMDTTGPLPAAGLVEQLIGDFISEKYSNNTLKATAVFLYSLVFAKENWYYSLYKIGGRG